MAERITAAVNWLLGPANERLLSRWLFLRGLGLIYFSAFFSLAFQIQGLIGPEGVLPAGRYLSLVAKQLSGSRWWYAPTVLWFGTGAHMLEVLWIVGMIASLLLVLNVWPRSTLVICFVAFLSFIAAAQDFSSYQSDGMLLEAGFISLFFAPRGLRPGLGEGEGPSRASYFLLQWLWLRIYFESGMAKILGGDVSWRNLSAMDLYYQNGPLPTWLGWYAHQLPHWFHVGTAGFTLFVESVVVWMFVLPRRWRIACFLVLTPFELGIILTANYCFLNYLVMLLGVLLLDDRLLRRFAPRWLQPPITVEPQAPTAETTQASIAPTGRAPASAAHPGLRLLERSLAGIFLAWIFYATTVQMLWRLTGSLPLPTQPIIALEPFRIANSFGLFGRMTPERYEIEFQGSQDGVNWTAYPFRYKPQDPQKAPGIYAPYQPRFDWNLWFASLKPGGRTRRWR